MDAPNSLPNDVQECQRLLLAAYRQSLVLEQAAEDAKQLAMESEQQAAELTRVLDETAASYQKLQQEHAATLDELAWYKRWGFGRRRERFAEGEGQGHLFELDPPLPSDEDTLAEEGEPQAKSKDIVVARNGRSIGTSYIRSVMNMTWSDEEKICSCCGRLKDCIGEDVTRELEYQPAKLEAHVHASLKYACRHCKDGVSVAGDVDHW